MRKVGWPFAFLLLASCGSPAQKTEGPPAIAHQSLSSINLRFTDFADFQVDKGRADIAPLLLACYRLSGQAQLSPVFAQSTAIYVQTEAFALSTPSPPVSTEPSHLSSTQSCIKAAVRSIIDPAVGTARVADQISVAQVAVTPNGVASTGLQRAVVSFTKSGGNAGDNLHIQVDVDVLHSGRYAVAYTRLTIASYDPTDVIDPQEDGYLKTLASRLAEVA